MSQTLQWAIERADQLYTKLRMFQGLAVQDWKVVLYQSEQMLADIDALTIAVKMFHDLAVQQLRKEAGL